MLAIKVLGCGRTLTDLAGGAAWLGFPGVPDATVTIKQSGATIGTSTRSQDDPSADTGLYGFDFPGSGTYTIQVTHPRFGSWTHDFSIDASRSPSLVQAVALIGSGEWAAIGPDGTIVATSGSGAGGGVTAGYSCSGVPDLVVPLKSTLYASDSSSGNAFTLQSNGSSWVGVEAVAILPNAPPGCPGGFTANQTVELTGAPTLVLSTNGLTRNGRCCPDPFWKLTQCQLSAYWTRYDRPIFGRALHLVFSGVTWTGYTDYTITE